jgi:hypothetical protein
MHTGLFEVRLPGYLAAIIKTFSMKKIFQVVLLTFIVGISLYGAITHHDDGHLKCTREWSMYQEHASIKNNAIQTIKY